MPITIDSTLRKISRQAEEENTRRIAESLNLTYAVLDNHPFALNVLSLVPFEEVKNKHYAVYLKTTERIKVAVLNPQSLEISAAINNLTATLNKPAEIVVVSPSSFDVLVDSYEQLIKDENLALEREVLRAADTEDKNYFKKAQTLQDLQDLVGKVSVSEIIDVVMAAGYNQHASDIHIEPGEKEIVVRFRIDGVLQKVLTLPSQTHQQIISRIKMMANIRLDEKSTIQDGRFSLQDKGINADIRVSTIPTGFGEGVVMRILRQDMQALSLDQLGFSKYNQDLIKKSIHKPYGLILVTGPTGSGKSTTLYALLNELNSPEKKIITLEDPVEYRIAGLQQSQVDPERGFTFAEGLKGALRQDPDVVMVGEIRDPETATIALNASLTGHLVLSTLHTNNAVTSATRLLEMGIAPFLLSGSIQLIIAQRLVRKVVAGSDPANPVFKDRLIISEAFCPNQEFEQAVIQHKDSLTLEELAVKSGMISLMQDGLDKVKQGLTIESEIYRVTSN